MESLVPLIPLAVVLTSIAVIAALWGTWAPDGRPVLPANPESRPVEDATVTADRPTARSGRRG